MLDWGIIMQKNVLYDKLTICRLAIVIVLIVFLIIIPGCSNREPPSVESAEEYFQENRNDILLIVSYLIEQENAVHIDYDGNNFKAMYNLEVPDEIKSAIKGIRCNQRICVEKLEDTIYFRTWIPPMSDISSGIAFSIDGDETLDIQYVTTQIPMSESGWYYYVCDFNTWRVEQTRDTAPHQ